MFKTFAIRKILYFGVIIFILIVSGTVIFTEGEARRDLPVLMYHSVLKDKASTGKYVVTPKSFESDIKYLTERGYKSVTAKEVAGFVCGENDLPEKPYLITFDDGCYNNLTYVLPILKRYDAYAVVAVVGAYSEKFSELDEKNPSYSYLRWCDIKELADSGRVEIANHSYNFHSYDHKRIGAKIKKGEDKEEYRLTFLRDLEKADELLYNNCQIDTKIYAYPYGAYCDQSEEILEESGYIMTFTCNEGINKIGKNLNDLKLLKRFNRHGLWTTDEFFKKCKIF